MAEKSVFEQLKEREARCVCKMCGSPLEIRMIIFNQYGGQGVELYCPHCDRIEYGTEPEIFETARAFLEQFEFNYFPDMAEGERNKLLNTAKLCEIIAWSNDYLAKKKEKSQ